MTNHPLLPKETHREKYLLITVEVKGTDQDQGVRIDPQSIIAVRGIKGIKDLPLLGGPERNLKAPNIEEKREKLESKGIVPDPIQDLEAEVEKDTVVRDQGHIPILEASVDASLNLVQTPETGRGIDTSLNLALNPERGRGIDKDQDLQIDCIQAAKLRKKLKPKTSEMEALWEKQTDWTFFILFDGLTCVAPLIMPVTFMFSCLDFKVTLSVININHNSGILILLEIQINTGYTNINRGSNSYFWKHKSTRTQTLMVDQNKNQRSIIIHTLIGCKSTLHHT